MDIGETIHPHPTSEKTADFRHLYRAICYQRHSDELFKASVHPPRSMNTLSRITPRKGKTRIARMAASLYDGRLTMKGVPNMLVKTWSLALLLLSLVDPVKAQTPRPVAPALVAAPVAVPQRVASKLMPSVVSVPPFTVVGTALTLPLAVNVPAFDVTGTLLKLPLTVRVSAFDVTGTMLKLPLTVAVPAFAVTGTYKP